MITEAIEEQLRIAHIQQGMDADDRDLTQMAQCLGELSACDVPKLFSRSAGGVGGARGVGGVGGAGTRFRREKTHAYGMRPGFCIDSTG